MIGEIITIGNEIISGETQDLNAWYAAGRLTRAGLRVKRMTMVGDDPEMVTLVLRQAKHSSEFVIVTGGLGSTDDDITNEVVALALERPLCIHQEMLKKIKKIAHKRNIPVTNSLLKMAYMPSGSQLISEKGVACGFYLIEEGVPFYFLPGIPEQMRYLLDNFVLTDILNRFQVKDVRVFKLIRTYGLTEPEIAEAFRKKRALEESVIFGFYPQFPENHITITANGEDSSKVQELVEEAQKEVLGILKEHVFSVDNEELEEVVGRLLKEKGLTLSTAESCTGGLVSHRLTNVAGSSEYYLGGVVAYSNHLKESLLGVTPQTLDTFGAVSMETVKEMAEGIRKITGSDLAVAISGIAGPSGGTKEKPVGTVCLGFSSKDLSEARTYRFFGSRIQVKQNSAAMALDWIRRYLCGYPVLPGV